MTSESGRSLRKSYWKYRLLPAAILLVCASWLHLIHIYLPPQKNWLFFLLICAGFGLFLLRILTRSIEPWTERLKNPRWSGSVGILASILFYIVFPAPYGLLALPFGIGWLILTLLPRNSPGNLLAALLIQIGATFLVCAALLPLVTALAARYHDLPRLSLLLSPVIDTLLHLGGIDAAAPNGALQLTTFENILPQTLTTEKLFPLPLVLFWAVWSGVILLRSHTRRLERLLFFWLAVLIYATLRFTALLIIMIQRDNPSFFYDSGALVLSLLPLILLTREPDDLPRARNSRVARPLRGLSLVHLFLGMVTGAAAILIFVFHDPGTMKAGRLLINEHGSDWEWTQEPMDTVTYNEKTTYNYYCLAEYLKYFYDVAVNQEPLAPENLRDVDVLILKMPTQPYGPEEIEAVVDFVERGGGVWIVGDHTNVFGSSSFLNPLLARYGCRLNYNSTHDLQTGNLSLYEKPAMFAHPSVVNLPPYLFATSCAAQSPLTARSAILGYGLRVDHLEYSQKNFFPDRSKKLFDYGFGLFQQQVAVQHGKGRLLIYTDSTTFSNFFMFIRGKPELVLGTIDWLNRTNRLHWVRWLCAGIAAAALFLLIVLHGVNGAAMAGLLLGLSAAGWQADRWTAQHYPLPSPQRKIPALQFDRQHSDYFLPTLRLGAEGDKSLLTFYVWTQRLGAVPTEAYDLETALSGRDPLVVIDPTDGWRDLLPPLDGYLQRGGRLLLINSADNPSASAHEIAARCGLNLTTRPTPADSLHTLTRGGRYFPLRLDGKISTVEGGETLLRSDQDDPLIARTAVGPGSLTVAACGHLFRDRTMGPTTVVPDDGLLALYRIEYTLIQHLLGK